MGSSRLKLSRSSKLPYDALSLMASAWFYQTCPHSASPEQSALKFCHRYIPAAEVGGDFFTIFPITDCTAGVFICDVMGHGMRAALITAIMRGLLEELTPVAADPAKFLAE